MKPPLTFFVSGTPKGQPRARARFGLRGVYDPGTANEWKAIVRAGLLENWDRSVFTGPVALTIVFFFPRPQSHYTKKGLRPNAAKWCQTKPDADNSAKAVMDAMSSKHKGKAKAVISAISALGVWKDDAQVCRLVVEKLYGSPVLEGAEIEIKELE